MANDLGDQSFLAGVDCPHILMQQNQEIGPPEVIKVTDSVYLALGFSVANSIMLVGAERVVIVDTTDTIETGREVMKEFRKITSKPIEAIIYTHHHSDHLGGAEAFIEDPDNPPDIWSHHTTVQEIMKLGQNMTLAYVRGSRQFGGLLKDSHVNCGIGKFLDIFKPGSTGTTLIPNRFLEKPREFVNLAGLDLELIHIPGETNDQIGVWWPERKTFMCADDIYRCFPNLYAIRGTVDRNVLDWAESLNKMLQLDIHHLAPGHTRPVSGQEKVKDIITTYRDAILYVHDETVKLMNQGLHRSTISEVVKLPEPLASHPYLEELYGTVAWSVKTIYNHYAGWFTGDPAELSPLTSAEKGVRMEALAGGKHQLLTKAQQALNNQQHQWALELAGYVMLTTQDNNNADGNKIRREALQIRINALKYLAGKQTSAGGRNYYLMSALEEYFVNNSDQSTFELHGKYT